MEVPPFPVELSYLWKAFVRIRRRVGAGLGPSPMGWPDIKDFMTVNRMSFAPWEINMIEDLDDMFMTSMGGKVKQND